MSKRAKKRKEFETKFYEGILKYSPDFTEALSALGDLYTGSQLYKEGLAIDERLLRLRPDDPVVLYNLACSYSLLEMIDKSFTAIQQAVSCGYDEMDFIEDDPDLDNLRLDERFAPFLKEIKQKHVSKK